MFRIFIICFFTIISLQSFAKQYNLFSPDKKIQVIVSVTDKITWSVLYEGRILLVPGEISMHFAHGIHLGKDPEVRQEKRTSKDEMISAIVPVKSRFIRDRYNALNLVFKRNFTLQIRAYDEGVAYRFETNFKEPEVQVISETADFRFAGDYQVFWPQERDTAFQSHFENLFKDTVVSAFSSKQHGNLPMLLTAPSGVRLLITEADLYDYPNMFLYGSGGPQVSAGYPKVIKTSQPRGDRGIRITELAGQAAPRASRG